MKGRPAARVRVGVGGWSYPLWRGSFYPDDLPQARELEFASRALGALEINATFYRLQQRTSFARWRDATPDDFVFTVKAPRFVTHRAVLAEAGPALERFLESGVDALGPKLGPINWQFPPTKRFEPDDLAAFLALLPGSLGGRPLRHAVEVRHPSFAVPEFVALAQRHGVAVVLADHGSHPRIPDLTASFVYVRLQRCEEKHPAGYAAPALAAWAGRARAWAEGRAPADLPPVAAGGASRRPRDVFVFFIAGFKPKAPLAALALSEQLRAD